MRAASFITAFALGSVALALACTSGAGPGVFEPGPSGLREPPGSSSGPESPGPGGDRATTGPDPTNGGPESTSSGAGSGGGSCPACDRSYTCTLASNGIVTGGTTVVTLLSSNGQCLVNGAVFSCNGTIAADGGVLAWKPFGTGGFSFTIDDSDAGSFAVDCLPGVTTPPTPIQEPGTNGDDDSGI